MAEAWIPQHHVRELARMAHVERMHHLSYEEMQHAIYFFVKRVLARASDTNHTIRDVITNDMHIPKPPFEMGVLDVADFWRLVHSIDCNVSSTDVGHLFDAAEIYAVDVLKDAHLCSRHRSGRMVEPRDINLAIRIRNYAQLKSDL